MPCRLVPALAALVAAAGPASAQSGVIFSTYATSPTSAVPGLDGVRFRDSTYSSVFDRPYGSPDGTRWMMRAVNNSGAAADTMLIVGRGLTSAGATVVVREGGAVPFEAGSTWGATINSRVGINDAGQFAFVADLQPATVADGAVVRWTGSAFEQVAREGGPAPGIPFTVHGATLDSAHILANGDVRFRSTLTPTTGGSGAVFNMTAPAAGTVLALVGLTLPTGNLVPGTAGAVVSAVSPDSFTSDAAGTTTLYRATLGPPATTGTPANETVVVRNNAIVVQEGAVLPGSGFTATVYDAAAVAGQAKLSANGQHYVVQGSNNDGGTVAANRTDWVYRTGAVVAATDTPIFAGSSESWTDAVFGTTFFTVAVNNRGDTVVGGLTTNPDSDRDAVLVLNGTTVLLREGDFVPFDVDGDGTVANGEGKFIRIFNDNDVILTNTHVYVNVELADAVGAGASTGQAFVVVPLPVPEPALGLLLAGPLAVAARRAGRRRRPG